MTCILCEGHEFEDVAHIDSKTSEPLRVSLCSRCGLIQQKPIPTAEDLKIYYSHNYRLDYKKAYTPEHKHIFRAGKVALQRLGFMKKAGVCGGSLLDVGAGGGEFVYLSSKMGFKSQGIEPNIGYSEYAKKEYQCSIYTGEIDDIDSQHDVITMFHVLEHLPSPIRAFEKLYQSLNSAGILFVEVPWIESYDASPRNIFFKAHIYYFSVDTLIACASPYFEVLKVDTQANLKIIFKARETPATVQYPDNASVNALRNRLKNKGWFEYLFKGRGFIKPVNKLLEYSRESKAKHYQPKEILDRLFVDI